MFRLKHFNFSLFFLIVEADTVSIEEEMTTALTTSQSFETHDDNLTDDKKTAINNTDINSLDNSDKIGWDNYWDKLESNVLGLDPN